MKPQNIQIPRALYRAMRDAIRMVERDSRRDDRVLHDETIEKVKSANDDLTEYQDARWDSGGGA